MSVPFLMTSPPRLVGPVWEPDGPVRGKPRTIAEVIARLEADGTLTPAALMPDAAAATPPAREAYGPPLAGDIVPGHQRLTFAGLAAWERTRAAIRERNAALLALSVAAQKAAIKVERAPLLERAQARLEADRARDELASAASAARAAAARKPLDEAVADHRTEARQWAKDHPDAAEWIPELQAYAREKSTR